MNDNRPLMKSFDRFIRRITSSIPGVRAMHEHIRARRRRRIAVKRMTCGNYGSTLPDPKDVEARAAILFDDNIDQLPGIDLRVPQQLTLLQQIAPICNAFDWPGSPAPPLRYHTPNFFFDGCDAVVLHAMLRHLNPSRVIEAGSGFSSALMLDTNDRHLNGRCSFTFIDPFPDRLRSLLTDNDRQRSKVIPDIAQNVPLGEFAQLDAGDILFIDSSHVSKIGSDVNYLLFDVLPSLKPGVVVHLHDIFWPFQYPRQWIDCGWAWNEAYILRAFLQYNHAFEILLFNHYLTRRQKATFAGLVPKLVGQPAGSIWLRKR